LVTDYKEYFSHFFKHKRKLWHFAAHSHHPWPDKAIDMHLRYVDDTSALTDEKWSLFFSEILPKAQEFVADLIGDSDSDQIVFAANTHEFIVRLLSCLQTGRRLRILSSDHEFYSFKRQMLRLEEDGLIEWRRVGIDKPAAFYDAFSREALSWQPDMVFCSHVTFDRGLFLQGLPDCMSALRKKLPVETLLVIDGYHSLGAVPCAVPAGKLDGVFYLGGSYKYLSAGEGACFMRVPRGCSLRPRNTGWFADFAALESGISSPVGYAEGAQRFAGATMDFSAIYRLVGTGSLWAELGFSGTGSGFQKIHTHVSALQSYFLSELSSRGVYEKGLLKGASDLSPPRGERGSFLCFGPVDLQHALPALKSRGVLVDGRESVLRIGFGVYQSKPDVDGLLSALEI